MADLPEDVTAFIDRYLSSVMALEVLLHLARHDRVFEPRELSSALGGSPDAVIICLHELEAHGLIAATSEDDLAYRYAPSSAEVNRAVHVMAETYARRKVTVVTRIFDRGPDDLRSFSDAFKFRKR
jgi:DNA-binding IclR family transcriptional regulator